MTVDDLTSRWNASSTLNYPDDISENPSHWVLVTEGSNYADLMDEHAKAGRSVTAVGSESRLVSDTCLGMFSGLQDNWRTGRDLDSRCRLATDVAYDMWCTRKIDFLGMLDLLERANL